MGIRVNGGFFEAASVLVACMKTGSALLILIENHLHIILRFLNGKDHSIYWDIPFESFFLDPVGTVEKNLITYASGPLRFNGNYKHFLFKTRNKLVYRHFPSRA